MPKICSSERRTPPPVSHPRATPGRDPPAPPEPPPPPAPHAAAAAGPLRGGGGPSRRRWPGGGGCRRWPPELLGRRWPARRRAATRAAPLVGVVAEALSRRRHDRRRSCRAGPGGVGRIPRSSDLGVSRAASPDPLRCVVGPDPVEGRPCSAAAFLDAGLARGLLVGFGAADFAGCRRVAWGLLARLQ